MALRFNWHHQVFNVSIIDGLSAFFLKHGIYSLEPGLELASKYNCLFFMGMVLSTKKSTLWIKTVYEIE